MNNIAIVTGGSRGIGRAISCRLNAIGYKVFSTHRNDNDSATSLKKETSIDSYQVDVTSRDEVNRFIAAIEAEHGGVDILINNAGITADKMFHRMEESEFDSVISTNLKSCFNMTKSVIDGMRQRQYGRIVNVSSVNAITGQLGQANYCASKAGIIGFTKALALENAKKGITVNAIAPGYTMTDMLNEVPPEVLKQIVDKIPLGRLAEADEIAYAVEFLCSPMSAYITGATLSINGGLSLS